MKRWMKWMAAVALAMILAAGIVMPVQVQAAQKINAVYGEKKAQAVKKGKTYVVTSKKYLSRKGLTYLKFTAPKDGKYKFTFSGLTVHGKKTQECITAGSASLQRYEYGDSLSDIELDFGKGQKGYSIYLSSEYSASLDPSINPEDMFQYLPKRSVSLKLEKGAAIYIAFNFIDTCDINFSIK